MKFNNGIPIRLESDPIIECVLEIRFDSLIPSDAVYGTIYQSLLPVLGKIKVTNLPILNIPSEIREKDQALKYQPWWQIIDGTTTIGVSPNMISFSVSKPYCGWDSFSSKFSKCMEAIIQSRIIQRVTRVGIRFINIFEKPLNYVIGLKISTETISLDNMLRVFLNFYEKDESMNLNCRFGNDVTVTINKETVVKTIIDLDAFSEEVYSGLAFKKEYMNLINRLHDFEKNRFFTFLSEDCVRMLNPIFHDEGE